MSRLQFVASQFALYLAHLVLQNAPLLTNGKVAGVDFGSEYFKVALVKPGTPFEIVTNIHSKRKTEAMVAFDGEERYYGADAATIGVRRPNSAYAHIRRLLGASLDHPEVMSLLHEEYYPYELTLNQTRGSIMLHHANKQAFHAEELTAMVLTHVRQITDAFAETDVRDYVLTVPDFFTQSQRQALLDAAELSRIRVLSLINENTAAALQLCVHSSIEPEKPKKIMFYNLGASSLQVSIVELSSRFVNEGVTKNKTINSFTVLSKAWDERLGGAKFDLRLTEHFAKTFNAEKLGNKDDIRDKPRPMAKIRAQASKTKVVLSANEEIPVTIQSLYNDIDFTMVVSRSLFEETCKDLFDRVLLPVEKALQKAGLLKEDIDDIELIGGGVRIPKIQQILKDFFAKDLSVHLNGDEAMALGAAFRGANLSNSFRVRHVGMTDLASYGIGARLVDLNATEEAQDKPWVKRAALFTESHRLGMRKAVSFAHTKDISCTFRYEEPQALPEGIDAHIAKYAVTGVEEFALANEEKKLGDPKVTLTFTLDSSGIVSISKAEATLEEEYEAEVEVKKPKPKEEKEEQKEEEVKEEEMPKKEVNETSEKPKEEEFIIEKVKQMRKRTLRGKLTVVLMPLSEDEIDMRFPVMPMTDEDKKEAMEVLRKMEEADNKRKADLDAKNRLEAYVYASRDKLSAKKDQVDKVTVPEQVEELENKLEATEEWLYDDGDKVEAEEYNKRLRDLEAGMEAIFFRIRELKEYPKAIQDAQEYAFSTVEMMKDWETSKAWVTDEERQDVLSRVSELETWIKEAEDKHKTAAVHEPPIVTSAEVKRQVQNVKKLVAKLAKKPKPEPPKPDNSTDSEASKEAEKEEKAANFTDKEEEQQPKEEEMKDDEKEGKEEEKNDKNDHEEL